MVDDTIRQSSTFKRLTKNAIKPHEASRWESLLDKLYTLPSAPEPENSPDSSDLNSPPSSVPMRGLWQ